MSAPVRDRGAVRMVAFVFGAMALFVLALPINAAQAQFTFVDFGVTSLPPLTSVRMSGPYARSLLVWPGAARLPVVMP